MKHMVFLLGLFLVLRVPVSAQKTFNYTLVFEEELEVFDTILHQNDTAHAVVQYTVLDETGDPFPFVAVGLAGVDSTYYGLTDENGTGSFHVPPDDYEIVFSCASYGMYTESLRLNVGEQYHLYVRAVEQHTIYNVHSSVELSTENLRAIRKCLRSNNLQECSTELYTVTLEI